MKSPGKWALAAAMTASCGGSTGGDLVNFPAAAAGPPGATAGQGLEIVNDRGWKVTLTKTVLHVGAVYLNQSIPVSGAQDTSCILPGTYVAQVIAGQDVDLLSGAAQPFPAPGTGVTFAALAGQVWLTWDDVNTVAETRPVLTIAGTAERAGVTVAFQGAVTIGSNRAADSGSTNLAGANPICKQRIVSPIPAEIEPESSGSLLLRIDPAALFINVDFGTAATANAGTYTFPDDSSDQPSRNLYQNLHSSAPYRFEWVPR
jgi:hypothetical protein